MDERDPYLMLADNESMLEAIESYRRLLLPLSSHSSSSPSCCSSCRVSPLSSSICAQSHCCIRAVCTLRCGGSSNAPRLNSTEAPLPLLSRCLLFHQPYAIRVRLQRIRHARNHSVGKYQSCMF